MFNRQILQCADAVLASLRAASLSIPTQEAMRRNRPLSTLEELKDLQISVVPRTRVTELANRSEDRVTLTIDVGIQKLFGDVDVNTASDPLINLTEEIAEHFARKVLTGADGVSQFTCQRTVCGDEDSPFLSGEHAQTHNLMTGVVSLHFVTWREVGG